MTRVVLSNAFIVADIREDSGERPTHPIAPGGPYPDQGLPGDQPGIWGPGDPRPTPPIVIPPDAIAPGTPSHPIYIPVQPGHPIVIPPGAIGPGVPEHPIVLPPPAPGHPIVIPPDAIAPGEPAHPIVLPPVIWPPPVKPSHPIVIPPAPPGADEGDWVYSPVYGWVWDPGAGGKPQPVK